MSLPPSNEPTGPTEPTEPTAAGSPDGSPPPDSTARIDVFISYRRTDRTFAEELVRLLQERGVIVWYDGFLAPGAAWRDEIARRLAQTRLMVIILSANALESKELRKELAVADLEDVPLLAVRLEDVRPRESFAYELARGNWHDIFPEPKRQLAKLVDHLASFSQDRAQIPASLQRSFEVRRERVTWESRRRRRRNAGLIAGFLLLSVVEFALYEQSYSASEKLIRNGMHPLRALGLVAAVSSVGSPIMFLSTLKGGIQLGRLPLLVISMTNTIVLLFLVARSGNHLLRTYRRARTSPPSRSLNL